MCSALGHWLDENKARIAHEDMLPAATQSQSGVHLPYVAYGRQTRDHCYACCCNHSKTMHTSQS